jgi:hypothetical protein
VSTKVEPSGGVRAAHVTFAIIGTIALTAATWLSVVFGGFATTNDPCGSGDSDGCTFVTALLYPPLAIWPLALILTWLRSRQYSSYVPHGWSPFLGLALIGAAWLIAYQVGAPPA